MWGSMHASFSRILSDTMVSLKGSKKRANSVYKDEPRKKPRQGDFVLGSSRGGEEDKKKNKDRRRCGNNNNSRTTRVAEKEVMRVKVKMTKEEAARLMSKCKQGGVLGFRDVANELVQIPINRLNLVSFPDDFKTTGERGMLNTIPEEI